MRDAKNGSLSRRKVLQAAGLASATIGMAGAPRASAAGRPAGDPWGWFADGVEKAFRRMNLVGAAVALVTADDVVHLQALGRREVRRPQAVTSRTGFLVASTTKSMSSLLVATAVDRGQFGWDDRVRDVWPAFRAPTPGLTAELRVRDLLGMATGIGEPPALSALHEGDPTAEQLVQSLVNLPVAAAPGQHWIYNNTVYALGGYLPMLNADVGADRLAATYGNEMHQCVFGPTDMTGARICDDPRGIVPDYARGHGLDLDARNSVLNYGAVGSYAPVGGALASVEDMAAYVQMQLRGGVSRNGQRVVSAANLAECWKPHIPVPISPELDPDVVASGYAMGWIRNDFRDGTALVWHNGAIDGFTAYIGFFPERDLGLVVLNAMNPGPTGTLFYTYVLNLLLGRQFGLNPGVPDKVDAFYAEAIAGLKALDRRSRPVKPSAVDAYLGFYEGGYQLTRRGVELHLQQGSRDIPIRALAEGGYVMSGGLIVQQKVALERDVDGTPKITIDGVESVRRTVGLP